MREALLAAGFDCPPSAANFVLVRASPAAPTSSRRRGSSSAASRTRSGSPSGCRPRTTASSPRWAPRPRRRRPARRSSSARRRETALRVVARARRPRAASASQTGIGFLDHLLAQLGFHGGLDLEVVAGGDLDVDEHHTVEDVLAALGDALGQALDGRAGVRRYGSATVPMDEARATAAIDLVRRPHAEVALAFAGDRVGGLPLTLLPHALERFAIQAGLTLHVEARARTTTTSPRRRSRRSAARCARRARSTAACSRSTKGRAVSAVLVDYGAGNLRSVSSALARAGEPPTGHRRPRGRARGSARRDRRRRQRGVRRAQAGGRRPRGRPARTRRRRSARARHLPRHAAALRGERRGRPRARRAARAASSGFGPSASRTWAGTRSGSRRPSALLDGLDGADVYFAHSFACEPADGGVVAEVEHEGAVVAAVERGAVAGVQFHPERSASPGARVLANAVAWSRSA